MTALEPATLRCSTQLKVAHHLQAVVEGTSETEVTRQLIHFVDVGLVTPSVFASWLRISPNSLHSALLQDVSIHVRRIAIKELRRALKSSQWSLVWDSVGGVQGWVDLFSRFSVVEVKEACRVIGKCGTRIDCDTKRKKVTELFMALHPRDFPDSHHPSRDERTLSAQYRRLLPTCTEEIITRVIDGQLGGTEHIPPDVLRQLFHMHSDTLQAAALRYGFADRPSGKDWLPPLLHSYPSRTASGKGLSASMEFSLAILQRLVKEGSPLFPSEHCIDRIVQPLLRRAINKKAEWTTKQKIVDLAVKYVQLHPSVSSGLKYERNGLLHLVAVCWSHKPELFEAQFALLLTHSRKITKTGSFEDLEHLLNGVSPSRRYAVLRFCYKNNTDCDLDVEGDLKGAHCFLSWKLLYLLHANDALGLFNRVRSSQGEGSIGRAAFWDAFLSPGATPDSKNGDVDMWHTLLLRRAGFQKEAEELAIQCTHARKQIAVSSSTPERRRFYARAVFHFAIACESLELYRQAHEWGKRFIRDRSSVRYLYQNPGIEARRLTSGIPDRLSKDLTTTDLRERVTLANHTLSTIFDVACSALREPSYSVYDWHGTLALCSDAIGRRVGRANEIQDVLELSDEEVYDVLWKDALPVLIAMEEKALVPSHSRLRADKLGGIVGYRDDIPLPRNAPPSTYRFVDNLAKARDDLWRKYRPTIFPAAASLPDPFPHGLAIQHLVAPFVLDTPSLEKLLPYIASRQNAALYPDPSLAQVGVRVDEETQKAIGIFVDDYYFALELILPTLLGKEEKQKRVEQAWRYATSSLSQERMSSGEASRYWQTTKVYKGLPLSKMGSEHWPLLPDFNASSRENEPEEWDPMPTDDVALTDRTLDSLTYIDLSKRAFREHSASIHTMMDLSLPEIPGIERDAVWSTARISQAKQSPEVREAQILSSLLYLDTSSSTQSRILARAFPASGDHIRYPAVFLDERFLSDVKPKNDAALATLRAHMTNVPAPLLQEVTVNTIKCFNATNSDAEGYAEIERMAVRLVELLGHSDRPSLASELAVRTIIDHPDASSWHRRLLSRGQFRRLPADDARACITLFADGIIAKLNEQKKARETEKEKADDNKTGAPPLVKVTTIKLLAQLLSDAEFMSMSFALSVLKVLIEKTSHIDIRREVVNSLLGMLRTAPPTSVEQIIIALEATIPIAGNIRERRPITEDEWNHIEESLELPELTTMLSIKEDAPMLASLLNSLKYPPRNQPVCMCDGVLVERILIPIIENLKKQTERWVSVFLRKYNSSDTPQSELNIVSLPWHKSVMSEFLILASTHAPLSLLEDYVAYLRFNVETPPALAVLIKNLKGDLSSRDTTDVQIFLTRFAAGTDIIDNGRTFPLVRLLRSSSKLEGAITVKNVQQQFLQLYTSLLWHDTGRLQKTRQIVGQLWAMADYSEIPKSWAEHQGPIIEAIVMYIEGLRTREWDRDPNRRPAILPDTFFYRIWLLRYAAQNSPEAEAGDLETHCRKFAGRVAKIVESLAGGLYHTKFKMLQESLEYVHGENRVRVAYYLGDISKTKLSWLTMPDLLRVELAAGLLKAKKREKQVLNGELAARVEELKESWRRSESEQVRLLGVGYE